MTTNISGFGLEVYLRASSTYPLGIIINAFADDADPLDAPSMQIADAVMGLNGDLLPFAKANPVKAVLSVIPGSLNDIGLSILLEANRVGKGKIGARDEITMVIRYPNNDVVTLLKGVITDGMPMNAVSSAGRLKSKSYSFSFENKVGA